MNIKLGYTLKNSIETAVPTSAMKNVEGPVSERPEYSESATVSPLDIVYLFRHSKHDDLEIRYSLRSVAKYAPFIRKVWIFGSRPAFLSDDTSIIEHVPHAYMAPLLGLKSPVRNDFLMVILASMIPELSSEFLRFSDDYILLQPASRAQMCKVRAVEDLTKCTHRGSGKWKAMLWRTYDILRKHGYEGINFESHTPFWTSRKLVFEAFMSFKPFLSEGRFEGMHSGTAIGNYALRHHRLSYNWLADEQNRVGFYGACPAGNEIVAHCDGKLFLSYDDDAFGTPMQRFLQKMFPVRCKYEHR